MTCLIQSKAIIQSLRGVSEAFAHHRKVDPFLMKVLLKKEICGSCE